MSLKDLFNNPNLKSVTSASMQDVIDDSESLGYLESYVKEQEQFRPTLDFSSADNFVRFGSAEKYYVDSIERIYKSYPYDGSRNEKVQFFLSSSDLDNYIFENEYPRTNGYANFIRSAATSGEEGSYYYPSTSDEYILVKGGPNTSERAQNAEITDTSGDYKSGYANTYDFAKNRESNLKIGGIDGNTVEFWLKKDAYVENQEYFEFILDANVTGSEIGDETFGRFSVALATTGTAGNSSNQAFSFLIGSGSTLISSYIGSSNITTGTIADGTWHHYALRYKTVDTNTVVDLFVDGEYDDTTTVANTINYVSGNVIATVGALSDPIKASSGAPATGSRGWAPFSGSLDEFRYWKVWRDSQEIGRQYIEPIGAGTNTDDANTHLGVYFKFNEGITQTASIDATVLDYSGRISNGIWTGYSSDYSRNTGSAMVESGKVDFEYKDPILYSSHPAVASLLSSKRAEGQEYDYRNPNSIYKSIPTWITEQDYGKQDPALENLTQILSSYFDTLHAQVENLSSLKHISYISGTSEQDVKPYFFNNRILESYGFPYIPDLFKDASFLEYFRNRDDKILYEEKLYNIKNIIYNNIYNNLAYINKSKGTEKAFRNFFRCFGLDEEILKIRYYSNNGEFEYLDNTQSTTKNKKYVNFSLEDTLGATVYQYKTGDNTTSFISGSDDISTGVESTGHGFTLECQTIFPVIPSEADYNKLITNKNHTSGKLVNTFVLDLENSIYGLRTAGTTENDLTVPANDRAGFTIKSIKQNKFDKRCKFKLEATNNSYFSDLESPYFEDVFDDTKWNFAVTVKPTNYGQSNFVSGSEDVATYDVTFMGTRVILGETLNSFEVTSTISNDYGKTILTKPKRVFIGAERENLSGSLTTRAYSNITDCRYWLKPLSMAEIKKHNTDVNNYGVDDPYDSAYLFQDDLTEVRVSNIETLALDWNFNNLTSSDASGEFNVDDISSGSADDNRYGSLSGILSRQHSGRGEFFEASNTNTFVNKNVYNTKTELPGYINSSDMINITEFDDMTFTRETRPVSYFMTIEKSMYQTISEEMIKIFSTMRDYGSLVGKQYSKYRVENKDLKHLRQLFFENISNTPKLERYIDYYKWFDTSLNILVSNLIPMSALRDENDPIIKPVVEEHVFNKEKYLSQFPTIEFKTQEPEATIRSINELLYNWEFGHAPISQDEAENCLWFKDRAERDELVSSGDSNADSDRQEIIDVINNLNNVTPPNLSGSAGSYQGSTYALRKLSKPLRLNVAKEPTIHGGGNAHENKKVGIWDTLRKRTTLSGGGEGGLISIEPTDSSLDNFKDCDDDLELNRGKRKYSFSVGTAQDGGEFSEVYKGDLVFPFSLYSSSLDNNPAMSDLADFQSNLAITNLHHDNYGPFNDVPMQGPFTEKFVGGRAYRHVMTNFTPNNANPDTEGERLEGWRLTASADSLDLVNPESPRSVYFREEYAKRPVNIKNIKQLTSSADTDDQATDASGVTRIGNYTETYEVVMTNGRSINNRYMVKSEGDLPTTFTDSTAVSGVVDFAIPRRDLTGSNKAVIVNRFASPGDPATMGEGMLDVAAAEYSVYNALPFRNLTVREALQELYSDHANQFGYFSDQFNVAAYELAGETYPGGSSSVNAEDYSGTGSFHKVNRNGRPAIKFSGSTGYEDDSYLETTKYDNFHVQHQIPQTDLQYAWITASIIEDYSGSALYGFEQPDYSNSSYASTDLTFISASSLFLENDSGTDLVFAIDKEEIPGKDSWFNYNFSAVQTGLINYLTASENFVGLADRQSAKTYINQTLWNIGGGEFSNFSFSPSTAPAALNALLNYRQGPWGAANWKLYRKDNHPIVRAHRKENRLSYLLAFNKSNPIGDANGAIKDTIASTIEPPLTSKYKEANFFVNIKNPKTPGSPSQPIVFNQSYLNNFIRFSTEIDSERNPDNWLNKGPYFNVVEGYDKLTLSYATIRDLINGEVSPTTNPISSVDKVLVNEVFWPKQEYTYLSTHRQRENYVNDFWRSSSSDRREKIKSIEFNANPYNFQESTFQGDFALTKGFAISQSFAGPETVINGSNIVTTAQSFTASIWPLDARKDFATASPGRIAQFGDETTPGEGFNEKSGGDFNPIVSASQGEGILQNSMYPYSNYARVSASTTTPFFRPWLSYALPQYNRRIAGAISSDATHEYKFGDTKWEAAAQSGLAPFYDTYSEYIEDIKRSGKDHSIIPEFRISEHMDFYLTNQNGFNATPDGVFELTGTEISSSEDTDFYKTYMHSDFMEMFGVVTEDFNGTLENKNITITADAMIKFLPYDGFYPADRTVQLARLFYESYTDSFVITGAVHLYDPTIPGFDPNVNAEEPVPPQQSGFTNPVWKSLFAPGLLYNSIKSGIAVDYPVHTTSSTVQFTGTPNQRNSSDFLLDIPRISSSFGYRVPFEALVIPDSTEGLLGKEIVDNEPHPSASLDLTASLAAGSPQYSLAMNNFLASTIDFFLPGDENPKTGLNNGNMTTFISDTDKQAFVFDPAVEYKMRIVCYNGKLNTKLDIDNKFVDNAEARFSASYSVALPSVTQYAQTGSDSSRRSDYYGSAFGPPCDNFGSNLSSGDPRTYDHNYGSASFEPYTPPYYDGYSHIEITLPAAAENTALTTQDILDMLDFSYYRQTTGVGTTGVAATDAMNLSASINIGAAEEPSFQTDASGNPTIISNEASSFRLVIQPKWECPILDFSNSNVTLPSIGSGSVAQGMWHQYGSVPFGREGIFLQVQDLDDAEKDNPSLTGSLADVLGIDKTPKKLGEVAETKTISEAIVAIPFTLSQGTKQFYNISRPVISDAILKINNQDTEFYNPSEEIIDMVTKMQKYVIPPHLDFVTNQEQQPFAMFIIPFEVQLKRQDLVNIWQNLTPEIGTNAQVRSEASLPVGIFSQTDQNVAMLSTFDKNTRWMVFKVKQKSSFNYFAKTKISADDDKFKFDFSFGGTEGKTTVPKYSYNWPYDFFSLIELGKLSAQHTFEPVPPIPEPTPPSQGSGVPGGETQPVSDTIAELNLDRFAVPGTSPTGRAQDLPGVGPGGTFDPVDPTGPGGVQNSTGQGASTPDGGPATSEIALAGTELATFLGSTGNKL